MTVNNPQVLSALLNDTLPHLLRAVLKAQGISRTDMSLLTGIPEGTVGSWTSRALLRPEVKVWPLHVEALVEFLEAFAA